MYRQTNGVSAFFSLSSVMEGKFCDESEHRRRGVGGAQKTRSWCYLNIQIITIMATCLLINNKSKGLENIIVSFEDEKCDILMVR